MTEKMKPSGIAWINDIPASWKVKKIKYYTEIVNGSTPDSSDFNCWDGPIKWITPADMDNTGIISKGDRTLTQYGYNSCGTTMLPKGSVVISSRAPIGKINITGDVLCTNQGCKSLVGGTDNRYLYYLLLAGQEELVRLGRGTTFIELSTYDLANFRIVLPQETEQCAIADFLDTRCTKIDSVIADIEKQIETLQKYKKSLITEAVTKGLKPDAPMRSSKVEYVSSVPDHWEEKRLNIVAYVRARLGWRGLTADEYVDEGYAFLSAFNIVDDKLDLSEELLNYITKFRYDESPEIKLRSGDVLLVKDGAGLGKCARIDYLPFETAPNGSLAVITPNEQLHYRYLYYFFVGDVFQQRINQIKNGMGVPHLPQGDLRKIVVPIPPMDEQIAISDYLDDRCALVDPLLEAKEKQLQTMKQHKRVLIYEYVTGKRRVKEVG